MSLYAQLFAVHVGDDPRAWSVARQPFLDPKDLFLPSMGRIRIRSSDQTSRPVTKHLEKRVRVRAGRQRSQPFRFV